MASTLDRAEALDIVEIPQEECWRLLEARDLGRLAVVGPDGPEIFPVNYGVTDGHIVIRTHQGTKLRLATLGRVAFEVDHFDPLSLKGWDVQARGLARDVTDALDATSKALRAVEIVPWVAGEKTHRIAILDPVLTGRRLVAAHDGDELNTGR
jgi:nitroimidazol reductase NimA-like FMN-containing flavoprotein (pyridoxamine 5'-phosphate oxidase superfamily)